MEQKYRVHEFAKDFGMKSADIMELLDRFEKKERTHMAVLTQGELDYLFNYYTRKNQVESFAAYFALANQPKKEPEKPLRYQRSLQARGKKRLREKSRRCRKKHRRRSRFPPGNSGLNLRSLQHLNTRIKKRRRRQRSRHPNRKITCLCQRKKSAAPGRCRKSNGRFALLIPEQTM